jgi:hypothetical protein
MDIAYNKKKRGSPATLVFVNIWRKPPLLLSDVCASKRKSKGGSKRAN